MSQIQIPEIVLVSILFVNTSILVYTIVGGCENVLREEIIFPEFSYNS